MSINTERLIECVRNNAILYDPRHQHYKNVAMKATVWETIASELNETSDSVKNKWRLLRDNYSKYKRHVRKKLPSKASTYNIYKQLKFLNHFTEPNITPTGTHSHPNVRSPRYPTPSMDSDQSQMNTQTIRSSLSSHSSSPIPTQYLKLETNSPLPSEETQTVKQNNLSLMQNRNRNVTVQSEEDKQNQYDECDHLFASYACAFKRLPPLEQILMKLKLAKLFANVELRMLQNSDEPNVQYNVTLSPDH